MQTYEERTLLRLRRKYTENEIINLQFEQLKILQNKLKECEIEKGILKSDLSEANFLIERLSKELEVSNKKLIEARKRIGDVSIEVNKRTAKLNEQLKQQTQQARDYQNKYLNLLAKERNLTP